jgi:small subunit ribosomal protein S18
MAFMNGNGGSRERGRGRGKGKGKGFRKKGRPSSRPRVCRFCADKKLPIDYKDARLLTSFVTERGRIVPRRISGNCARHQREVTLAIKRGRILAIIPFTATQLPLA